MSIFDALDRAVAGTVARVFGDSTTYRPMTPAADGGALVADGTRAETAVPQAVWSAWAVRAELDDNGLGRAAVPFATTLSGRRMSVFLPAGALAYAPRAGDEVETSRTPGAVFSVVEILPDGMGGYSLMVVEIA